MSDEIIKGQFVTKFPGSGLEFGEGTIDCLVREFKDETGLDIEILQHFYTTDFCVPSAFNAHQQIISIYYKVEKVDTQQKETLIEQSDYNMSDYIIGFN